MSNTPFIVPKQLPNPEGQAKLILASNGLGLIQPQFFKIDHSKVQQEEAQQPDLFNWMGLPVFDTVTFDEVHYETLDGKPRAVDKLQLINCMHVVNMVKNVIKTPIPGAEGTVKEFIGLSDYSITLSGFLVSQYANVPPELEMKELYEFCKAPVPIPVYSNFLAFFEVFSIVIDGEPTFTQLEGIRNAIQFTINCVSDKDFAIEYNQNKLQGFNSVPSFQ